MRVGDYPPPSGVILLAPIERKGVDDMEVTWPDIFTFGIFLVALISLVLQANDKKK